MKITTKHRIRYKRTEAPGEPVEMAIYRDVEGNYMTAAGDMVVYEDGELSSWVERMLDGTSKLYVGEIIPPPLEPYVGMVVEHPDYTDSYLVCYRASSLMGDPSDWVSGSGQHHREPYVLTLIKRYGWRVREGQA